MSVVNTAIFHCLKCGRVVHIEPSTSHPVCCGVPMTLAVPETAAAEGNGAKSDEHVATAASPT